MELNTLQTILNSKKRGQYMTITYEKVMGAYTKTTTTTIRLVDYNNVAEVKAKKALQAEKPAKKTNSADKHLGNNLIYNANTGKTRLQVFLTKHHKPHCIYTYNGNEIDKDTYYANSGDKQSTPSIMFTITIDNIIAIK